MGANNSKKATFYHDYGNGGWVYYIGNYHQRKMPAGYNRPAESRQALVLNVPKYTTSDAIYRASQEEIGRNADCCCPSITQYPRPGEVSQGSDNNISFNGGGWTYTMDMGPYVDVNNASRNTFKGITTSPVYQAPGLMWARAKDPDGFYLKDANNNDIPFRIAKVAGDARDWPAWYLWVAQPLKPGTILGFNHYAWLSTTTGFGVNDHWMKLSFIEDRLGQTEGGVRFAPVTDSVGNTWGLNHP